MSKYHSRSTEFGGVVYRSKKEAQYAQDCCLEIRAGELVFFDYEVPFQLPGGAKYLLDFLKVYPDELWFVEVKGYKTPLGELKRKQAAEIYNIKIEVV